MTISLRLLMGNPVARNLRESQIYGISPVFAVREYQNGKDLYKMDKVY